jgi:PAS domain S-box-containing protein
MQDKGHNPKDESRLLAAAEALFDRIPDVVFFVKDRDARYITVNHTLVERCGVSGKNELIGKTVLEFFAAPMGESYYEQDRHVLEKGTPLVDQLELHLYNRGEPGWCITNKVPLKDDDGTVVGLVGMSKDLHLPATEARGYIELAESIRHIQSHYGEPLRIDTLARISSLSVYQFEQRMKKIFQLTAGQFISKTRIEAACELLRASERPIVEVAMACGFSDQSAFSRQFKATTGLTPSTYRKR